MKNTERRPPVFCVCELENRAARVCVCEFEKHSRGESVSCVCEKRKCIYIHSHENINDSSTHSGADAVGRALAVRLLLSPLVLLAVVDRDVARRHCRRRGQ